MTMTRTKMTMMTMRVEKMAGMAGRGRVPLFRRRICARCRRGVLDQHQRRRRPLSSVVRSGNDKFTEMTSDLYSYMVNLNDESPILGEISDYTTGLPAGHMKSSPEQVRLFALLLKMLRAQRAIEIGVFTGYSTVGIAQALPEDGVLYAFERDPEILKVAKGFCEKAGVAHKVKAIEGDAAVEVQRLVDQGRSDFDFAFIDANKRAQKTYYEQCLKLVRPGGLVVVDNVLWYGRVVDSERNDKNTIAIRELNQYLREDDRIELTVLPVGDGIAICRKLGES